MRELYAPTRTNTNCGPLPVPKPPFGRRLLNRVRRAWLNTLRGQTGEFPSDNPHKVHFVYLVPNDRIETGTEAIRKLAGDLQEWYRWRMGGKTFTLYDPVVQVAHTQYPAHWYSEHNPGGSRVWWFWNNVLGELSGQFGGGFYQTFNDWIVYIDAEPAPDQGAGGTSAGTYSGVAVLGARDLLALLGQDTWTVCREIGGAGHEGGHSLGLPHPPPGDPNWPTAIMGVGYGIYPDCILTEADQIWLNGSPFFTLMPRRSASDLCPFVDTPVRPTPSPRPRPTPRPR